MTELLKLIAKKFKKNIVNQIGIGSILGNFVTIDPPYLKINHFNPVVISIFIIWVVILVVGISKEIIAYPDLYPNYVVKSFKILKFTIFFLLIFPVLFSCNYLRNWKSGQQLCEENLKKTGLLIGNFTEVLGQTDGFTTNLYGKLNSRLQNNDTINLKQLSRFISDNDANYLDTIKTTFADNCSRSGLIVFGQSNYEKYFNCRIYSYQFLNFGAKGSSKTKDKNIIYIQNPDIIKTPNFINFTIDNEASIVADFILGLLYNHAGNYKMSTALISQSMGKNNNPANTQFLTYCQLFIGNNSFKQKDFSQAIKEYKKGLMLDSTSDYIHYNLAVAYRQAGQNESANKEYEIANSLNKNFTNPLTPINTVATDNVKIEPKTRHNHDSKFTVKTDTTFKEAIMVPKDWEEHCFTILENKKYGVINNMGDTIVNCAYDYIESHPYKRADCYILKLNGKYGAVVHLHSPDGYYTKQLIPVEFSYRMIFGVVENCVDHH